LLDVSGVSYGYLGNSFNECSIVWILLDAAVFEDCTEGAAVIDMILH
jgi:hypothetical protein